MTVAVAVAILTVGALALFNAVAGPRECGMTLECELLPDGGCAPGHMTCTGTTLSAEVIAAVAATAALFAAVLVVAIRKRKRA